jgi:hypothetical protein
VYNFPIDWEWGALDAANLMFMAWRFCMGFLQQLSCKLYYENTSLWGWQSLGQSRNWSSFIESEVSARVHNIPLRVSFWARGIQFTLYTISLRLLFNWRYAYHCWYAESRQMDAKLFGNCNFLKLNLKDINCLIKIEWVYLDKKKNLFLDVV